VKIIPDAASSMYVEALTHRARVSRTMAVGASVLMVLYIAARSLATTIDSFVFQNASSTARRAFLDYRVWEMYRACLYVVAAAIAGYVMTRIDKAHGMCAALILAVLICTALLTSLFSSPEGFYLTDIAAALAVGISMLAGARGFHKHDATR